MNQTHDAVLHGVCASPHQEYNVGVARTLTHFLNASLFDAYDALTLTHPRLILPDAKRTETDSLA